MVSEVVEMWIGKEGQVLLIEEEELVENLELQLRPLEVVLARLVQSAVLHHRVAEERLEIEVVLAFCIDPAELEEGVWRNHVLAAQLVLRF